MNRPEFDNQWLRPPKDLALQPNEVHVWIAHLDTDPASLADMENVLSPAELKRSERFQFPGGREHYIAGRAILRRLLGKYTGIKPREIEFVHGVRWKPYLPHGAKPFFNMSDSYGIAMFAFSATGEVGIDIEKIKPTTPCERIAQRHFTKAEAAELSALPAESRRSAFFNAWTRKEAFVKAIGLGLYAPLNSFEITISPSKPPYVRILKKLCDHADAWTLIPLAPAEGFVASLVAEGSSVSCSRFQYPQAVVPGCGVTH